MIKFNPYIDLIYLPYNYVYKSDYGCRSITDFCSSDYTNGENEGTLSVKCKTSAPYGPMDNLYMTYDSSQQICKIC